MLDRESTFAHPEIVRLLKSEFVPVAIDQAYQRRQKDTEGEFYRSLVLQSPRDVNQTTQGFYVATAAGKLLLYNNNRDPEKVFRLMKRSLEDFRGLRRHERGARSLKEKSVDARYSPEVPNGGLVVRVRARVLSGYEATDNKWERIFQSATSRDNLWISAKEHEALARDEFPEPLARRIARFHLVDNTRGEPPMWKDSEIRGITFAIRDGVVRGSVRLETDDGTRGYDAEIAGKIAVKSGTITNMKMAAKGDFWGEGPFTKNAPEGKFPLAVTFVLADGTDTADAIPPQGSRGWVRGYIE